MPVKGVVDGDLCERYSRLGRDVKERIAAELDRSVREVERKISVSAPSRLSWCAVYKDRANALQDMRTRVAY